MAGRRALILLGLLALGAVVVVLLMQRGENTPPVSVQVEARTPLVRVDHGVQWLLEGADLTVGFTPETPERTLQRVRGRTVELSCGEDVSGTTRRTSGPATVEVSSDAGLLRVRLEPPPRRVTDCVMELPGDPEDVASVEFVSPRSPPHSEITIIR